MQRQLRLILTLKCRLNPDDSVKRLKSFENTWQIEDFIDYIVLRVF